MEYAVIFILLTLASVVFFALTWRRCVIFEHQQGLLYRQGKFVRILEPGMHWYYSITQTVTKIDMRLFNVTIPGQEVMSADNIGIKISLAASYRIIDPYLAINKVSNYQEALYLLLQINLRDIISSLEIEDILAKRQEIGKQLYAKSTVQANEIGVELQGADIKDIMFPGELKNIFAQVVNAKNEGLAALERARGESAALRNLANAAKLLDEHPNLSQLRLFQVLEKNSGNTVVIMPSDKNAVEKLLAKSSKKS